RQSVRLEANILCTIENSVAVIAFLDVSCYDRYGHANSLQILFCSFVHHLCHCSTTADPGLCVKYQEPVQLLAHETSLNLPGLYQLSFLRRRCSSPALSVTAWESSCNSLLVGQTFPRTEITLYSLSLIRNTGASTF
uniref:Uncharacterized protein n=1 Tax=Mustela putorius furo TaxID=9669 RepID=M3Y0F0_MUSPF